MWYDNPKVKQIIKEVAEDNGLTSTELVEVLSFIYNNVLEGMRGVRVKAFRIIGLGIWNVKGYVPRGMVPKKSLGVSYGEVKKYKKAVSEKKELLKEQSITQEEKDRKLEELI